MEYRLSETSFQRANRLAEESKRRKWATVHAQQQAYEAENGRGSFRDWQRKAFEDGEPILIALLTVNRTTPRRSTRVGFLYGHFETVLRPTELQACKRGRGQSNEGLTVLRKVVDRTMRGCVFCMTKRTIDQFARDKRFPFGLAFACQSCRKSIERRTWRDVRVANAQPKPKVA